MALVKLTEEEREVLRRLGKRSRAETEKRIGKRKLIRIARAQAHHGKKGGRPRLYPECVSKDGTKNKRHRFWKGKCSFCGIEKGRPPIAE
jgi:RecB family exonuclease